MIMMIIRMVMVIVVMDVGDNVIILISIFHT